MLALLKLMLKTSAVGALSIVALSTACSDSNSKGTTPGAAGEDSGGTSSGGTSSQAGVPGAGGDDQTSGGTGGTGGTGDAGGAGGAGGAESDSSAGGAGGADVAGPSVAKFCNTLVKVDQDGNEIASTLILEVGTGAEKVTFTAETGECVPADGEACVAVPQGLAVPLALFDAEDPSESLDENEAPIEASEHWIFWSDLQETNDGKSPIISGEMINSSGKTCEEVVYDDIPQE